MTAEISSWQLKKSNYSFGNPFFLKAKSQANNIAYLNITKSQNSPLDLVLKGPFRRHPARKKNAKHSLKDKTDDLAQQALWEKAGVQGEGLDTAELHLASAGSGSDQTVPWDKDATYMNNWTVL